MILFISDHDWTNTYIDVVDLRLLGAAAHSGQEFVVPVLNNAFEKTKSIATARRISPTEVEIYWSAENPINEKNKMIPGKYILQWKTSNEVYLAVPYEIVWVNLDNSEEPATFGLLPR